MQFHRFALTAALCALSMTWSLSNSAAAQQKAPAAQAEKQVTLGVGDRAPALTVEKWVKGSEVPAFEKGKVYMIEFWATWCPPCIASMPHISELQKKYKDRGLTVIGVSSADPRNTLEKVEKMVADKGDGMGYTVAWDKERTTSKSFMEAAGQGGIPCSFLIDGSGTIAYIGHPMKIDQILEQVLDNKHDIKALAADAKRIKELEMRSKAIITKLNTAAQSKDWETAIAAADELVALDAKQFGENAANAKFRMLFIELNDTKRAYAYARELLAGMAKDNAGMLNALAWQIIDPDSEVKDRDAKLALELATRANELTKGEDAAILDTLACAHFTLGDFKKAVEIQTLAADKDAKLKPTLEKYKKALEQKGSQ